VAVGESAEASAKAAETAASSAREQVEQARLGRLEERWAEHAKALAVYEEALRARDASRTLAATMPADARARYVGDVMDRVVAARAMVRGTIPPNYPDDRLDDAAAEVEQVETARINALLVRAWVELDRLHEESRT
jgi:hypothetical protein